MLRFFVVMYGLGEIKKGSAVASLGDEAVWCGPGMGANPFRRHRLAAVPPDYLSEMAVQAALSPLTIK